MADDGGFKLPGSSYDQLVKIVRAYGSIRQPTGPKDVGDLAGIDQTTVSRNNGFLLSAGIIEGTRQKGVTQLGDNLARALEHEMPDEIMKYWREVVDSTEFLQRVVQAVRVRNGMDAPTLQGHIAYTAGQKRSANSMAGAGAVVDILRASGRLQERDGKFVVVGEASLAHEGALDEPSQGGTTPRQTVDLAPVQIPTPEAGSVAIQFRVNIDCSVDDLPAVGAHLAAAVRAIKGDDSSSEPEASD